MTFEQVIKEKLNKYIGLTQKQLLEYFSIITKSKSINEIILSNMLGIKGRPSSAPEFKKANILPKTIRVEGDGRVIESMSFPAFKYKEIIEEDWYNSTLRNMFESTKIMFVVFRKNKNEYYFDGVIFWNMSKSILDTVVRDVWERTVDIIKKGEIVKDVDYKGKILSNFPRMSDNPICHVRPHARNTEDVFELPVPDRKTGLTKYVKHCFWLGNRYIQQIIIENINNVN